MIYQIDFLQLPRFIFWSVEVGVHPLLSRSRHKLVTLASYSYSHEQVATAVLYETNCRKRCWYQINNLVPRFLISKEFHDSNMPHRPCVGLVSNWLDLGLNRPCIIDILYQHWANLSCYLESWPCIDTNWQMLAQFGMIRVLNIAIPKFEVNNVRTYKRLNIFECSLFRTERFPADQYAFQYILDGISM